MAKMGDTGIGDGGSFISPAAVFDCQAVFDIVDAKYRPARGEFKEQVNVTVVFHEPFEVVGLDADKNRVVREIPAYEEFIMSLGHNEVRQKLVDWFAVHPIEALNGVDYERGLVLALGKANGKGKPPYIFADAPDRDLLTASDVPF